NDADGDGVCGDVDICPGFDDNIDTDGDTIPDGCDTCPTDPLKSVDTGQCGCNVADTDTDTDGIADCNDNCPAVANPDQTDSNNNGIGDACDSADTDGDGVSDQDEWGADPQTDPLVPDDGSALLASDYHAAEFMDDFVSTGGEFFTSRASLSFDGTTVTGIYTEEATSNPAGPEPSGTFFYNLESDYSFTIFGDTVLGNASMDPDNNVLLINDPDLLVDPDDSLTVMIAAKKGTAMDRADLAGEYIITQFMDGQVSQATPDMFSQRMFAAFDDVAETWGYATLPDIEPSVGYQSSTDLQYVAGAIEYDVAADGAFLIGPTQANIGFVSPDGEMMVLLDTYVDHDVPANDDDISLSVGVRYAGAAGTMDESSLDGEFAFHETVYETFIPDPLSGGTRNTYAWVTFDGLGDGYFKTIASSTGDTSEDLFTYTVTPDGFFFINSELKGILSSNGEYLVVGDTDWLDADAGLSFGVGIKKPESQVGAPGSITVPPNDFTGDYTISWTPSATSEVSYELQEATDNLFSDAVTIYQSNFAVDGEILSYAVTGKPAGTFYYRVRALKAPLTPSGYVSDLGGCLVYGLVPPAWVSLPTDDADGTFTISWAPVATPSIQYVIEEATQPDFSDAAAIYILTETSKVLTRPAGTFYYRVMSRLSGIGTSSYTNAPNAIDVLGLVPPAWVSLPTDDADGTFTISWAPVATPSIQYVIEEATLPDFSDAAA
ncbi:MAG: thrombospondin type 3 repeat-containing protein, partial [candidate division Zixibacteria bacterium]|nr:thrombospondin type 3 repeat-containing protein [candidate division Zixibacteria bacterium]